MNPYNVFYVKQRKLLDLSYSFVYFANILNHLKNIHLNIL